MQDPAPNGPNHSVSGPNNAPAIRGVFLGPVNGTDPRRGGVDMPTTPFLPPYLNAVAHPLSIPPRMGYNSPQGRASRPVQPAKPGGGETQCAKRS